MNLIQGSTYILDVELTEDDGAAIDLDLLDTVEFAFGKVVKKYPSDSVSVDDSGIFKVSLSQADTFSLEGSTMCQFRVKYKDGQVKSTYPTPFNVTDSISKVEL